MCVLTCAFGAASSFTGAPLRAQSAPSPSGVPAPTRIISTNPFLPFWGDFQAEYEQRLNTRISVAVAGSSMRWDRSVRDNNLDAKMRFYPSEHALEGFGLSASAGVIFIQRNLTYPTCPLLPGYACAPPKTRITAPTIATEIGYQWLLGPRKRTAVTTSVGVKRYFASDADMAGDSRVRPMGRLSIGYAF